MKTRNLTIQTLGCSLLLAGLLASTARAELTTLLTQDFEHYPVLNQQLNVSTNDVRSDGWARYRTIAPTNRVASAFHGERTGAFLAESEAYLRYWVSPAITGDIGTLTFDTSLYATTETIPVVNMVVFLSDTNSMMKAQNPVYTPFTNITVDVIGWTTHTVTLDMYGVTNKHLVFGRDQADPGTYRLQIDNIVLKSAPASLLPDLLQLEGGMTSASANTNAQIELIVTEKGVVSSPEAKLLWRYSGEASFTTNMMNWVDGRYTSQVPTGAESGRQVEYYAILSFTNELGPDVRNYPEDGPGNPFRFDILPVGDYGSINVSGAFPAVLSLTTNGVWHGAMERDDAVSGQEYWFEAPGQTWGASNPLTIPLRATPIEGESLETPVEPLERDVVFSFSEASPFQMAVEYGNFQSFENWSETSSLGWQLNGGVSITNDASAAQSGSHAVRLGGGLGSTLQTPVQAGIGSVAFWFRRASIDDTVTVTVEKHVAGTWNSIGSFLVRPTDQYEFRSLQVTDSAATSVRFHSSGPVLIDNVSVTDLSSVEISGASVSPAPVMALLPANFDVSVSAVYAAKIQAVGGVVLHYRYGTGEWKEPVPLVLTNGLFKSRTNARIEAAPNADEDLQYYVTVVYSNWDNVGLPLATSATNTVSVIPYSEWGWNGLKVGGDLDAQLFLADNGEWRGARLITEAAPVINAVFSIQDLNGNNTWGDAGVTIIPAAGTAVSGEEISLSQTLASSVAFFFDETTLEYSVQEAEYLPFDDVALMYGWSATNFLFGVAPSMQGGAAISTNSSAVLVSPVRTGIGTVSFWACMANGASSSSYTVQVYNGTAWVTPEDGAGLISGTEYSFYSVTIGNPLAERIRVTFNSQNVLVDEATVTAAGAYVVLGDPTFNGNPANESTVPVVEYAGRPILGISVEEQNGAVIENVRVGYTFNTNSVSYNFQSLTDGGLGIYTNRMPALAVGTNYYFYVATFSGIDAAPVRYPETGFFRYVTSDVLPVSRKPNIGTVWPQTHPTPSSPLDGGFVEGWRIQNVWLQDSSVQFDPTTNNVDQILIRSPSLNGIGTIYFKARPTNPVSEFQFKLEVAISTSATGPWQILATNTVPVGLQYTSYKHTLNDYRDPLFVRIKRILVGTEGSIERLAIRDIVISPPPADVAISEPSVIAPGYPSKVNPITFYSRVVDRNPGSIFAISDATPYLVWRHGTNTWTSTPMALIGGSNYSATIAPQQPGQIEYYTKVDFTGPSYRYVDGTNVFDESRSPSYLGWDSVSPTNSVQTSKKIPVARPFRVRLFNSNHGGAELRRYDTNENAPMQLVGDHTWQAMLFLTNAVAMPVKFAALNSYTPGATAYGVFDELWGDNDQFTVSPPLGDQADLNGDPLMVVMDYVGFVMFRLNITNGLYQVRRASFQDFNEWQANEYFFEESVGLYAAQTFGANFDGLSLTSPGFTYAGFDGQDTSVFTPPSAPVDYKEDWRIENTWVIADRVIPTNGVVGTTITPNKALRINSGVGTVQSTAEIHRNGRDAIGLRHRIASGDDYVPYHYNGFAWQNYRVRASASVSAMSPANPSISLIGYYRNPDDFYELRVTQTRDRTANNNNGRDDVLVSIYRKFGGQYTLLAAAPVAASNQNIALTNSAGTWDLDFQITNRVNNVIHLQGTVIFGARTNEVSTTHTVASDRYMGGTISFNLADAAASFSNIQLLTTSTPPNNYPNFTNSAGDWSLGGTPAGGVPTDTRWTFNAGPPASISRTPRPVTFEIRHVRTGTSTVLPSKPNWQVVPGGSLVSSSLAYSNLVLPLKTWDNSFLQIRPLLSDSMLVVDDLLTKDWRGYTVTDPSPVPINDPDGDTVWRATEAYVTERTGSKMIELTRSRANPANAQMIVSPVLEDGVGTVAFDYQVSGGTVQFVIERATNSGVVQDNDPWTIVGSTFTNTTGTAASESVPVRTNMYGRARIRLLPASDPGATLWLDNVSVTTYPKKDDTSWEAYNALITGQQGSRSFEPGTPGARTAFLNNDPIKDVAPEYVELGEHLPFIQSTRINAEKAGVGEIGFWYRAWNPLDEYPGRIKLMVAPSAGTPSEEWVEVTLDDPVADAAYKSRLNNITNSVYEYFSIETFDEENFVLRIVAETNQASRVAIDNVLVTEPVSATIEVLSVHLNPDVPLGDEPVKVDVLLGNPRMNPTDIRVYLNYHIGTNIWGTANWGAESNLFNSIQLVATTNDFSFTTPVGSAIPGLPIDAVVQYRVVVHYKGLNDRAQTTSYDSFVNPAWYYPVDLNQRHASSGFSPYYFVFSCPTNSVFINEFFYAFFSDDSNREFVEIIGPLHASVGGWKIDSVDATGSNSVTEDFVRSSYVFPADAYLHRGTNNWGFYVVGDTGASISNQVDLVFHDFGNPAVNNEDARLPISGGFRLVRSMGAFVDLISYGAGSTAQTHMPARGYTFTVQKPTGGTTGPSQIIVLREEPGSDDTLSWQLVDAINATPGTFNPGQSHILGINPYEFDEPGSSTPVAALALEIISIQLGSGAVTVTAAAWSTNPLETTDLTGWSGVLETNASPSGTGWAEAAATSVGFTTEGTYPFPAVPAAGDAVFFRIKASNPNAVP